MASRDSDEYGTPQGLFDVLHDMFNFELDVCASSVNQKGVEYWTKEDNCLTKDWPKAPVFMNPPYSSGNIGKFMAKAVESSKTGSLVVALVRQDPSTAWWQCCVHPHATYVAQFRKRLRFEGQAEGANDAYNFPVCLVIYGPKLAGPPTTLYLDELIDTLYWWLSEGEAERHRARLKALG